MEITVFLWPDIYKMLFFHRFTNLFYMFTANAKKNKNLNDCNSDWNAD